MFKIKTDDEVRVQIRSLIELARANQEVESDKVDFKQKWYDLTQEQFKMELVKDASAIANTIGGDGFIVIGVDTKGKIHDVTFRDSGLSDERLLQDIFARYMDTSFTVRLIEDTFDQKRYSILHIPPSNSKPHLIKEFYSYKKNKETEKFEKGTIMPGEIFIRKGTTNRRPSKAELDDIYRYRHEFQKDIELYLSLNPQTFAYWGPNQNFMGHDLCGTFIIENTGYRPVSIDQIILTIEFNSHEYSETIIARSYNKKIANGGQYTTMLDDPILVRPNNITSANIGFQVLGTKPGREFGNFLRGGGFIATASVKLTNLKETIEIELNKV